MMIRVGFEPTQISLLAPEASALDRSAISPSDYGNGEICEVYTGRNGDGTRASRFKGDGSSTRLLSSQESTGTPNWGSQVGVDYTYRQKFSGQVLLRRVRELDTKRSRKVR